MARTTFRGTRFKDLDYSGTTFDDEIVDKILEAARIGCPHIEIALYAGVSRAVLYRFYDQNPDFKDKVEALRHDTSLQARINVRKSIIENRDIVDSKWYLERKNCDEFSISQHVDVTGIDKPTISDKQTALHDMLMQFAGAENDSKPTPGD